jgi:hypothetical protein
VIAAATADAMEAEHLNAIAAHLDDLEFRSTELRRFL